MKELDQIDIENQIADITNEIDVFDGMDDALPFDPSEIDLFAGKSPEEIAKDSIAADKAKKDAAFKKSQNTKLSDNASRKYVELLTETYRGITTEHKHWTLTLIAILNRVGFAYSDKKGNQLSSLKIAQSNLTPQMCDIIQNHIGLWTETNPDYAAISLVDTSVPETFELDNKAESSANPDWGNW